MTLLQDIPMTGKNKAHFYARKGDRVKLISDRKEVLIVHKEGSLIRFSVRREDVDEVEPSMTDTLNKGYSSFAAPK